MKTILAALLVAAGAVQSPGGIAQNDSTAMTPAPSVARRVPFAPGERMTYLAKYGPTHVGRGSMEIVGIEDVRGRPAVHSRFMLRGGWLWFRAHYLLESWVDRATFSSLRFSQDSDDDPSERDRVYEIFPERRTYRVNNGDERPSVEDPLDEGALLYYVRTMDLEVGKTYTLNRYFRPDRNPVIVKVLRRETVKVPAGEYQAIVIQPIIKSRGIFSEGGQAQIWLSDDRDRVMVQMRVRLKVGNISLQLLSHDPGTTPSP